VVLCSSNCHIEKLKDAMKNKTIEDIYNDRDSINRSNYNNDLFYRNSNFERYNIFFDMLYKLWGDYSNYKDKMFLEVGAGTGGNLLEFMKFGFEKNNIYANEINPNRGEKLKDKIDDENIFLIDAANLTLNSKFDVIFQSTVFSSILDFDKKVKLAKNMYSLLKEGGVIMWYDLKYNNPSNKNVQGITKSEIKKLFPKANTIEFFNVTLASPIARKIPSLYIPINFLFPFLRSHIVAIIYK
jgi:SAM-dependent methyltransferase